MTRKVPRKWRIFASNLPQFLGIQSINIQQRVKNNHLFLLLCVFKTIRKDNKSTIGQERVLPDLAIKRESIMAARMTLEDFEI